ncbi:MAG: LicD family protein [Clostridiales bacterium]|nr:LicD family protein [Clostridiales bacterium]
MACTLTELQDTMYDILCKFDDFCTEHGIKYELGGGTLLGAVRHDGFIPWDDDVDVNMDVRDFKKFVRCYKRHPIAGYNLSWLDTAVDHPFNFAKLRKNGTFMPEDITKALNMHNGVWLDIFVFSGVPENKKLLKLKEYFYYLYSLTARLCYNNSIDAINNAETSYNLKYRLISRMPPKMFRRFRKLLFSIYTGIGGRRSKLITYNESNYNLSHEFMKFPRSFERPTTTHAFRDRMLPIPVNYEATLNDRYGDWRTPVEYPCHTDLSKIVL